MLHLTVGGGSEAEASKARRAQRRITAAKNLEFEITVKSETFRRTRSKMKILTQ